MIYKEFNIKQEFEKNGSPPIQQHQRMLFDQVSFLLDSGVPHESLYEYFLNSGLDTKIHDKFLLETADDTTYDTLGSSTYVLRFLQFLIKTSRCKNALELGTFIGVSALFFAEALPENGKLITVETVNKFANIARINFEKNKLDNKIELIEGDLRDLYPSLLDKGPYDFIFIDANKESYFDSVKMLYPKLNKGGIIVVDDALFHGDVLNKNPQTLKGLRVKNCVEFLLQQEDMFSVMLPMCNGVLLSFKNR